jgi:altronate dehydratase small subunit
VRIDAVMIKEQDNVATALRDIEPKESVVVGVGDQGRTIQVRGRIPYGHKLATRNIAQGEDVIKYGEVIGRATQDIPSGTHAHVHNIESLRGRGDLETRGT